MKLISQSRACFVHDSNRYLYPVFISSHKLSHSCFPYFLPRLSVEGERGSSRVGVWLLAKAYPPQAQT